MSKKKKIPIIVYNEKKSKYSASHEDQLELQRNFTYSIPSKTKASQTSFISKYCQLKFIIELINFIAQMYLVANATLFFYLLLYLTKDLTYLSIFIFGVNPIIILLLI